MKSAICLLLLFVLVFCGLLGIGIWPPDLIAKRPQIVATETNGAGHVFRVVQYWNDDFYAVVLEHDLRSGERRSVLIDPDADKLWRSTVAITEAGSEITITGRKKIIGGVRLVTNGADQVKRGKGIC